MGTPESWDRVSFNIQKTVRTSGNNVAAKGTPSRGVEKQTAEDKIDFCGNVPSVC